MAGNTALSLICQDQRSEPYSCEVDKKIKDNEKLCRKIKTYLSRRHTGERLDDIGEHFGIGGSGVCKIWRQMSDEIEKDKSLGKVVKKLEVELAKFKT